MLRFGLFGCGGTILGMVAGGWPSNGRWLTIYGSCNLCLNFLAVMSSSRSDVLTQFVSSLVRPLVMKEFFKLKQDVNGVLSSPEEFQLCSKKV